MSLETKHWDLLTGKPITNMATTGKKLSQNEQVDQEMLYVLDKIKQNKTRFLLLKIYYFFMLKLLFADCEIDIIES